MNETRYESEIVSCTCDYLPSGEMDPDDNCPVHSWEYVRPLPKKQQVLTDIQPECIPDWDNYYMAMVLLVATRSKDPSTKCGAVLVSKDHRVLSIGYNGTYSGFPDDETVISRPAKYHYWLHAEENALLNYSGSRSDMEGATMYVTSRPCTRCLRGMIQSGISRIVFNKSRRLAIYDVEGDGTDEAWNAMASNANMEIFEEDFIGVGIVFESMLKIVEDRENKK